MYAVAGTQEAEAFAPADGDTQDHKMWYLLCSGFTKLQQGTVHLVSIWTHAATMVTAWVELYCQVSSRESTHIQPGMGSYHDHADHGGSKRNKSDGTTPHISGKTPKGLHIVTIKPMQVSISGKG